CTTDRSYGEAAGIEVTQLGELPVPESPRGYGLRVYDEIVVRVLQDESLNGTYRIDEGGQIDFPYIGMVQAEGRSAAQIQAELARRLSPGFIRDPEIVVRPTDVSQLTVSLGGEVASPGNYPVRVSPTLLRAINAAGGTAQFAQLDDVLIFREVEEVQYIGLYNLEAIRRGNYPDPDLVPGDVVMVGYSPARQRLETIFTYLPLLTTSVVLIDRIGR
ncbi:MAG: polysaccharide biosynthesis/export family protein, partial [Parerythrobacter sp.]